MLWEPRADPGMESAQLPAQKDEKRSNLSVKSAKKAVEYNVYSDASHLAINSG